MTSRVLIAHWRSVTRLDNLRPAPLHREQVVVGQGSRRCHVDAINTTRRRQLSIRLRLLLSLPDYFHAAPEVLAALFRRQLARQLPHLSREPAPVRYQWVVELGFQSVHALRSTRIIAKHKSRSGSVQSFTNFSFKCCSVCASCGNPVRFSKNLAVCSSPQFKCSAVAKKSS